MELEQNALLKNKFCAPKEIKPPNASELPLPSQFAQFQKSDKFQKNQKQQEFMVQLNKWFHK
jgi:hypothetical protein